MQRHIVILCLLLVSVLLVNAQITANIDCEQKGNNLVCTASVDKEDVFQENVSPECALIEKWGAPRGGLDLGGHWWTCVIGFGDCAYKVPKCETHKEASYSGTVKILYGDTKLGEGSYFLYGSKDSFSGNPELHTKERFTIPISKWKLPSTGVIGDISLQISVEEVKHEAKKSCGIVSIWGINKPLLHIVSWLTMAAGAMMRLALGAEVASASGVFKPGWHGPFGIVRWFADEYTLLRWQKRAYYLPAYALGALGLAANGISGIFGSSGFGDYVSEDCAMLDYSSSVHSSPSYKFISFKYEPQLEGDLVLGETGAMLYLRFPGGPSKIKIENTKLQCSVKIDDEEVGTTEISEINTEKPIVVADSDTLFKHTFGKQESNLSVSCVYADTGKTALKISRSVNGTRIYAVYLNRTEVPYKLDVENKRVIVKYCGTTNKGDQLKVSFYVPGGKIDKYTYTFDLTGEPVEKHNFSTPAGVFDVVLTSIGNLSRSAVTASTSLVCEKDSVSLVLPYKNFAGGELAKFCEKSAAQEILKEFLKEQLQSLGLSLSDSDLEWLTHCKYVPGYPCHLNCKRLACSERGKWEVEKEKLSAIREFGEYYEKSLKIAAPYCNLWGGAKKSIDKQAFLSEKDEALLVHASACLIPFDIPWYIPATCTKREFAKAVAFLSADIYLHWLDLNRHLTQVIHDEDTNALWHAILKTDQNLNELLDMLYNHTESICEWLNLDTKLCSDEAVGKLEKEINLYFHWERSVSTLVQSLLRHSKNADLFYDNDNKLEKHWIVALPAVLSAKEIPEETLTLTIPASAKEPLCVGWTCIKEPFKAEVTFGKAADSGETKQWPRPVKITVVLKNSEDKELAKFVYWAHWTDLDYSICRECGG